MMRLLRLAWSMNRRALGRAGLMVTLIVVGVSVFLLVTELSRASSASLDNAISEDVGTRDQVRIAANNNVGLSSQEVRSKLVRALEPLHPTSLYFVDVIPPTKPQCPPYSTMGEVPMYVLRDKSGAPAAFQGGMNDDSFDLCLGGLVVPRTALRPVTNVEKFSFGDGLVLNPQYESSVELATTTPSTTVAVASIPSVNGDSAQVVSALATEFRDVLAIAGLSSSDVFSVGTNERGSHVDAASDGIRLVYNVIGWGILLIVALGILVSQLVLLRDRTWLLGLARAVGAKRRDIATLVVLDVALLVLVGFGLAIVLDLALGPVITDFGRQAFNEELQLVRPAVLPRLALAIILTLAVGAGYPMVRAMRLDPADVLERR